MNKKIYAAKNSLIKQKKFYLFLFVLMFIGILSGIIFVFFIEENDKTKIILEINNFFNLIKSGNSINYTKSLINTLLINILYILLIWLLGISIIGFPIILAILFFKSFILGLSISSIILTYGFKGILGSFIYVFPHQLLIMILYLLLGFYSLSFCYKLFAQLFLKQNINFKYGMSKYFKILGISASVSLFISLYEVFISTYFMKLFTLLIK